VAYIEHRLAEDDPQSFALGQYCDEVRRDLRHTFASWYMMNGGDLYELAKILGHSNIKMTERYAKLAREHITKTSSTARVIWTLMGRKPEQNEGDQSNVA
jgi:integrase